MIIQYKLKLQTEHTEAVSPEWSYQLYAALLQHIDPATGEEFHNSGVTPISQYLSHSSQYDLYWTITLLGHQAIDTFVPVIDNINEFRLNSKNCMMTIQDRTSVHIKDISELLTHTVSQKCKLTFHSPTAFKSGGKLRNLPTEQLLLRSLTARWNACFGQICPIEDEDGEGVDAMADGLHFTDFSLNSRTFFLKGHPINGFIGTVKIENLLSGFQKELSDALLRFATLAGVGVKTTLGMGGVTRTADDATF